MNLFFNNIIFVCKEKGILGSVILCPRKIRILRYCFFLQVHCGKLKFSSLDHISLSALICLSLDTGQKNLLNLWFVRYKNMFNNLGQNYHVVLMENISLEKQTNSTAVDVFLTL